MWYRESQTVYVPKLEFDIQHRSGGNVTAYNHLEAARHGYPQETIFEITVPSRYVEQTRVATDVGMDYKSGCESAGTRCILKEGHGVSNPIKHASWWGLAQSANSGSSSIDPKTALRLSQTLNSISQLAGEGADELFRSSRTAETEWNIIVNAAMNMEPIPSADPSYYTNLYDSGQAKLKRCLTAMSGALIELQAHKHSDESLSKATWEAEKAIEFLANANCETNDVVTRGKMAVYASEHLESTAWAIKIAPREQEKFTVERNPFKS